MSTVRWAHDLMELLLPETDTALTHCRAHLNRDPRPDLAIEAYLTRHITGLMCAEVESVIQQLIVERVALGCDEAAARLVSSVRANLIRNAKFSEIGDKLALLGDDVKRIYAESVQRSIGEEGIARLGTAVAKRDLVAHSKPPDITFDELVEAYEAASAVVAAVKHAIAQTAPP